MLSEWTGAQSEIELSSAMTQPHASGFNAVAGALVEGERKALVDAMWAGGATIVDQISGTVVQVGPDRVPETGEALFYFGFLGSKRDGISTQHYMIPASDECTAITRAHELYEKLPKRRKGSSLRVMLGKPPSKRP